MKTLLKGSVAVLTVLMLGACGGDESSTAPEVPSIAGSWNFSETMNDAEHSISCENAGTLTINQNGSQFTGTATFQGICTGPGGSADNSGSTSISGGNINGNSVSFQADFCQYEGTLSGSPPNQVSGSGTCTYQEAGETFSFESTWQASR